MHQWGRSPSLSRPSLQARQQARAAAAALAGGEPTSLRCTRLRRSRPAPRGVLSRTGARGSGMRLEQGRLSWRHPPPLRPTGITMPRAGRRWSSARRQRRRRQTQLVRPWMHRRAAGCTRWWAGSCAGSCAPEAGPPTSQAEACAWAYPCCWVVTPLYLFCPVLPMNDTLSCGSSSTPFVRLCFRNVPLILLSQRPSQRPFGRLSQPSFFFSPCLTTLFSCSVTLSESTGTLLHTRAVQASLGGQVEKVERWKR